MARCRMLAEVGRRQFLRASSAAAASVAAGVVAAGQAKAAPGAALVSYPASRLANLKDLKVDEPLDVAYPDDASPGVLVKLGTRVEGGVGPDGDVVGFSTLCPHKGSPLRYAAADQTLSCPGHYSRYDCANGGQQIWGHAT